MGSKDREYIFHESTVSICPECLKTMQAKIVIKDSAVYIYKNCKEHGVQFELLEEDAEYYLKKRQFDKPGTASVTQTEVEKGCPYDCGLCPEHDQHTCIGLIEVTNKCNLNCPTCYASAGEGSFLDLKKVEEMMDFYQASEGNKAGILQISGGEPTLHPDIIEIIKLARAKKFKYVMLNTNGLRIAEDEPFVSELQQFAGGFEVYLQFDGFGKGIYERLRGRDLSEVKQKAVANLTKYKIPTTLVCTVQSGVNEQEIGKIIEFGINTKYIRGINFQPVAFFGRNPEVKPANRLTLSGVLNRIEKQTNGMLRKNDFIPLPCNVERVAITYLYKADDGFIPITRNPRVKDYLPIINNTFIFTIEDMLKETGKGLIFGSSFCNCLNFLKDFKQFVPFNFHLKPKKERIEYVDENTFRISVSSFVDAYNFDLKSMQKECVHVITPDLKRMPFSAYNMLHREGERRV